MRLDKFLIHNWPPLIDGKLVRSPNSDRISNYFTQYLQYQLQKYLSKNKDYYLLQEVECKDHHHKLDYFIGKKDVKKYFEGVDPRYLRWVALIESQWGNSNNKSVQDYLNRDFPKLTEYKTQYKDQIKIILLDMTGHQGDWKTNHNNFIIRLREIAKKDPNSHYTIIMTTRVKTKKIIGYTIVENWKTKHFEPINYN
ncbi:MAG: hypothetical protein KF816_06220 [Melioribacteraceae bacterium]|nr:hypothetical protein [Melioribacteraceae bacterium]